MKYSNSILKKKVLFGSDWPMISPERWLADFEKIGIKNELRADITKDNAAKLLRRYCHWMRTSSSEIFLNRLCWKRINYCVALLLAELE